jgi:hypothetical protein
LRNRDAACARRALGRPLGGPRRERVVSDRVAVDVVAVDQIFGNQHVHHRKRERTVGARHERDVLVALLCGGAAIRIDRDQPRAAALGFLRTRPEVKIGRDRVAAPDQDELAVLVSLEVHADGRADDRRPPRLAGRCAYRAVEQGGAQAVKEAPVHRRILQESHRACVAVGHDCLRSIRRGRDVRKPRRDLVDRLVPRDAREAPFALATDAAHRMQHTLV